MKEVSYVYLVHLFEHNSTRNKFVPFYLIKVIFVQIHKNCYIDNFQVEKSQEMESNFKRQKCLLQSRHCGRNWSQKTTNFAPRLAAGIVRLHHFCSKFYWTGVTLHFGSRWYVCGVYSTHIDTRLFLMDLMCDIQVIYSLFIHAFKNSRFCLGIFFHRWWGIEKKSVLKEICNFIFIKFF